MFSDNMDAWRRVRDHFVAHLAVNKADGRDTSGVDALLRDVVTIMPKLANKRMGFYHMHSGQYECGMAYMDEYYGWRPCGRLVNHEGECGYEDNSAF